MEAVDDTAVQEGHDREAAPEHERARLGEEPPDAPEHLARRRSVEARDEPHGRDRERNGAGSGGREPAGEKSEPAARDEDPHDLGLRPRRHDARPDEDGPEEAIGGERHLHELPRAPRDDRDDRRTDAVERPLHPRQATVTDVERGQDEHHQERGENEGESHERRAEHAGTHPAEVDRELRGQRTGRELREGEPLLVVLGRDPTPSLDEVALHVPTERDRAAKAERPEAKEVSQEIPDRIGFDRRGRPGLDHPHDRAPCDRRAMS